ncbi:hypothetical protein SAMN05444285_10520 [Draconibacterium orientale]|uniref:Helix-turn-helix domain-containing protein n=1 Tax=Draconibacterium orientale TaxID=1168034 RepID=A0A1I0BB27_9BACT|nr:hypothetical protein SAMN05444285_10520 [Draconibacterium orientale]
MITNYQRSISLDEVAQYIGMNRSSFCSFYKREKGKTFFYRPERVPCRLFVYDVARNKHTDFRYLFRRWV